MTDFLVACVCWAAYYFFHRLSGPKAGHTWFKKYFLVFAIGMTSAAWLGHGLQAYLTPEFKIIGWMCSATGLMFLQVGSLQIIEKQVKTSLRSMLQKWFILQWILAILLMMFFIKEGIVEAFKVTQINAVVALFGFILPMHYFGYKKMQHKGSKIVIIALAYSIIPGIVYSNQISISKWFNYHDISHVLMSIFMTLMFFGLYQLVRPDQSPE